MPSRLSEAGGRRRFRRRLLAWFRRQARDLPWRRTRDPYAVWVSEVMLQQTQVATVVPYFERFLARFPTIAALAEADEAEVLRHWEGLGYYRRARQMHAAARLIAAEHGGRFPRDEAVVRGLPGIGRYTAGAILSIAFDAPLAIIEANTLRLWSRLLAYRGDPRTAKGQRALWDAAGAILPTTGSGQVNQALMELGCQVCRPRDPACDACPLSEFCQAKQRDLTDCIPMAAPKTAIEAVRHATVIVRRGRRSLLVKCEEGQLWAGLWDFPRFELPEAIAADDVRSFLREKTLAEFGIAIGPPRHVATVRHFVTRFRITLDCHTAACLSAAGRRRHRQMRWVEPSQFEDFPLSGTTRRLAMEWVQAPVDDTQVAPVDDTQVALTRPRLRRLKFWNRA